MIEAHRIEYRGYSSIDFDLITCLSFESDNGEVNSFLTREAVASESYRGEFKRIHQMKYTETFTPKFTFVKEGFGEFTTEEIRKVTRWLTGGSNASFLTVYKDDSNVVHFEILGAFSNVSLYKIGNGSCVGFVAEFESAHPYCWSQLYTITNDVSGPSSNTFTIDVDSDEDESAIYPRITIQQNNNVIVNVDHAMINNNKWIAGEDWVDGTVYCYNNNGVKTYYYERHYIDGDNKPTSEPTATKTNPVTETTKTGVIIKNTYTDVDGQTRVAKLVIANNTAGEKVVLDGANRVVSSWYVGTNASTGQTDVWVQDKSRVFGDDFSWSWLPLYNGTNEIEVIGNCTVSLEYRAIRKIGEF